MLQITIPATELWDESKEEFILTKERTIQLEHSLVSLSKWESKWCKSFIHTRNKTNEEIIDYIKCMTITQNIPDEAYLCLSKENIDQIEAYIDAPMTATTVSNQKKGKINNEIVTAELIYYWMIVLGIPVKFEKWHINRLITLIQLCNAKNDTKKKKPMSTSEMINKYATLNDQRRKALNSKG